MAGCVCVVSSKACGAGAGTCSVPTGLRVPAARTPHWGRHWPLQVRPHTTALEPRQCTGKISIFTPYIYVCV